MTEGTSPNLDASDIYSFVGALPDFLAETKCPKCNSSDASNGVEGEKNVKYCNRCDETFGIDDSMYVNDLRQLMEEGRVCFKPESVCACGNDDVNEFVFEKCEQSDQLCLRCKVCGRTKDMEIIPGNADTMHEDTDDRVVGDNDQSSVCQSFDGHQHHQQFACECGNEENDCFEKEFDESGNNLVSVKCLVCDWKTNLQIIQEDYCLIECGNCGNNTEDQFDKQFDRRGNIIDIFCCVCGTHVELEEAMQPRQEINSLESDKSSPFVSYTKTKVTSLKTLKRGDHIAWKRCLGIYYHHAIVVEVLSAYELKVIHNTVDEEDGKAAKRRTKCKILEGKEMVDLSKEDLYLCSYEPGKCLKPDRVIALAKSLLGSKIYNLFLSNCEHFATFCKTAVSFSRQIASFIKVGAQVIGQILIPVPFVGYFIGSTIGDILKNFIELKAITSWWEEFMNKLHASQRRHGNNFQMHRLGFNLLINGPRPT